MENKKTICDYLKKNLSLKDYADLVETWEVHRCADGEENVFDLMDYADFHLFATRYSLKYALECQKEVRFWFGGNNYCKDSVTPYKTAVPFPKFTDDAYKLAKALIGDEYIMERTDLYEKYYDFEKYNEEVEFANYQPNNEYEKYKIKALQYPVVLQYFTIFFHDNDFVKIDYMKDNYCFNDILDAIANMAYTFTELYKYTSWNTTFADYALHYIIRHFDETFNELYEHREDMLSAKYRFKEYSEYYD